MENKFEQALNQQAQKDSLIFTGENITLGQATNKLKEELLKDKELNRMYWDSWKDNIAMAFYDAVINQTTPKNKQGNLYDSCFGDGALHEVSNKAAENFLNTLCK